MRYLSLLADIKDDGSTRGDRTGTGTKGLFGTHLRFSLENDRIPMITTKKMFAKGAVEELLFFVRGEIDTKKLEAKGVNIWKGNTSREFLDSHGLKHLPEGSMGKGYGFQWRKFGAHDEDIDYVSGAYEATPQGVDQLQQVFDAIKKDPYSRRHIVTAWNPQHLERMALPPCHMMFQFYVDEGTLSLQWYQRSVDSFLGLPFNILSYAILTRLMAEATGLKAKEVIFAGGDTHIYLNHLDQVNEQIIRIPYDFPTMKINKKLASLQDIESLEFSDFEFNNYQCHPAIKASMAI